MIQQGGQYAEETVIGILFIFIEIFVACIEDSWKEVNTLCWMELDIKIQDSAWAVPSGWFVL